MLVSEKERIEILTMVGYGDRRRTATEVCELFNNSHQDRPPIVRSTVSKIISKYREYGHVRDLTRTGRTKIGENTQLDVLLTVQENPHVSTRQVAATMDISKSSVRRVLLKNKYHPYKVTLVHELSEDDFDRRVEFCEIMQERCNNNTISVKNIIFSDEATFCLNGSINRQNCRYWATQNPRWMQESHTQFPRKVNVWAGIVKNRILGPYFFDGNLNGERYLEFLRMELFPTLIGLFPNANDPNSVDDQIWFQQDGAPPHYALPVRTYLNEVFPNRWIGRRGAIEWPARSPDLTPVDYFLWGYVKGLVYESRPENIDELKNRIQQVIEDIPPDFINNVQNEFISRLAHCQAVNGQQFEHLI